MLAQVMTTQNSSALQGSPLTNIAICEGPLDHAWLHPGELISEQHGAISSFCGIVRNHHHGRGVTHIDYQCYEAMAQPVLEQLIEHMRQQFDPHAAVIAAHAHGHLRPGDAVVAIHVAAAHRAAACDGCRFIIEQIKQDLPVWKNEHYDDGSNQWLPGS